jgi:predicted CoA-binding protein
MAAAAMLFPEMGSALYGIDDFDPAADYRYAMRLGASLMLGWTVLLLWADRRPLDRRGVLPITVFVIAGLAWAGAYAVRAGIIPLAGMVPTWFLQSILAVLFLYSYFRSAHASRDDAGGDDRMSLSEAARAFLAQEPIAVAGVSRAEAAPANLIFRRLEQSGRVVYPINPNADHVEGRPCYRSIADLPEPPGAVMIVTHPDDAIDVAQECMRERVPFVWFHRSLDGGSYSPDAAKLCAGRGRKRFRSIRWWVRTQVRRTRRQLRRFSR